MKDEQIAREIMNRTGLVNQWLEQDIAAALATARRAGFDACKEQALRAVSTLERYSTELERAHAAIRALEPSP